MAQQTDGPHGIVDFVIRYKAEHDGLSPTYQEIGEVCGLGKTTVKHHVDKLIEGGALVRGPNHSGLIVPGGQWVPPCRDERKETAHAPRT